MKARILLLPAALIFGMVASVTSAEPVALTEAQMDMITAGAEIINRPGRFRYESGNTVVRMRGHEGRVEYEVVENEDGSFLHVVVPSESTTMIISLSGEHEELWGGGQQQVTVRQLEGGGQQVTVRQGGGQQQVTVRQGGGQQQVIVGGGQQQVTVRQQSVSSY